MPQSPKRPRVDEERAQQGRPAVAPPTAHPLGSSAVGVAGGLAGFVGGAFISAASVGIVVDMVLTPPRDRQIMLLLAMPMVVIGALFGLALVALGIAAIVDVRRQRNGAAAGRLWALFGFGATLCGIAFVRGPSAGTAVATAVLLTLATPNFIAWMRRRAPVRTEKSRT